MSGSAGVPADPPPLHGVPITVKDALAVAGVRFTAGSVEMATRKGTPVAT